MTPAKVVVVKLAHPTRRAGQAAYDGAHMMVYRAVEHLSSGQALAAGASGASISFAAAMIDPAALSPWLHLVTLDIGSLTGLASLVLVLVLVTLKIVQQRRAMRGRH